MFTITRIGPSRTRSLGPWLIGALLTLAAGVGRAQVPAAAAVATSDAPADEIVVRGYRE